jgi:hypothetical protein
VIGFRVCSLQDDNEGGGGGCASNDLVVDVIVIVRWVELVSRPLGYLSPFFLARVTLSVVNETQILLDFHLHLDTSLRY